ncbi:hypothetical protein NPIL_596691 [Nephila pilipes]|uniref:Uncharacterized protein n=1 Tax=Nephila pilipes TaxID=299642 RepID=A0A8X6IEG8_NEPPI|nr:hypothetical protein NPIL_596691 [Nephila pilipes]
MSNLLQKWIHLEIEFVAEDPSMLLEGRPQEVLFDSGGKGTFDPCNVSRVSKKLRANWMRRKQFSSMQSGNCLTPSNQSLEVQRIHVNQSYIFVVLMANN